VIACLGLAGIDQHARQIPAREPAEVSPVVHSRHEEAEDDHEEGIAPGLPPHDAAAGAPSIVNEGSEQV